MRSVIKLGKMKKFTVDTAMFIIRRGVIYFLGALRNLLSANQFRQCQYLPRFARAIIPWIMFFEAAAVLYAWKGTWKSVQKYRDQIEFSWFTVGLWNRSQQYRPVIFDSRLDVFHTETLICLYAKLWPVDMQNLIFFFSFPFQCFIRMFFNASRLWIWQIYEAIFFLPFPELCGFFSLLKCTIYWMHGEEWAKTLFTPMLD